MQVVCKSYASRMQVICKSYASRMQVICKSCALHIQVTLKGRQFQANNQSCLFKSTAVNSNSSRLICVYHVTFSRHLEAESLFSLVYLCIIQMHCQILSEWIYYINMFLFVCICQSNIFMFTEPCNKFKNKKLLISFLIVKFHGVQSFAVYFVVYTLLSILALSSFVLGTWRQI